MNRAQRRALAQAARKSDTLPSLKTAPVSGSTGTSQPKQAPSQSRTGQAWTLLKKGAVSASVIAGLFGFAYTFRPQMKIERDATLDSTDPFATMFSISNTGWPFSFYNLSFGCVVNAPPAVNDSVFEGSLSTQAPVNRLIPGEQVARGCGIKASGFPLNAKAVFQVHYHVLGIAGMEKVTFISRLDSENHPQWFHDVSN
jgi:hypothetical protein